MTSADIEKAIQQIQTRIELLHNDLKKIGVTAWIELPHDGRVDIHKYFVSVRIGSDEQ